MKKVILSFILMITAQTIFAQKDADLIIGTWQTGSGNARVEIYKNANIINPESTNPLDFHKDVFDDEDVIILPSK